MTDLNALTLPDLFAELTRDGLTRRLFEIAREEDLGPRGLEGDVTSCSIVDDRAVASARVTAREAGVIAGLGAVPLLIQSFDAGVGASPQTMDGALIERGACALALSGPARHLLALERPLLNLLSRCSGVATRARAYVDAIAGTKAVICETRKTIPGWRALDKYASRCGGAHLHRVGLFDAALYKDNHLAGIGVRDLAARVRSAALTARSLASRGALRFVEVEVDTLEQLEALLTLEPGVVDIALLDNMAPTQLRKAVALRDARAPRLLLEASGGVTLETVRAIADTGVDRVSVGDITHSAPALDLGLDFE